MLALVVLAFDYEDGLEGKATREADGQHNGHNADNHTLRCLVEDRLLRRQHDVLPCKLSHAGLYANAFDSLAHFDHQLVRPWDQYQGLEGLCTLHGSDRLPLITLYNEAFIRVALVQIIEHHCECRLHRG